MAINLLTARTINHDVSVRRNGKMFDAVVERDLNFIFIKDENELMGNICVEFKVITNFNFNLLFVIS